MLARQAVWRSRAAAYPFICDFYVAAYRLVVEVDRGVHDSAEACVRDAWRDAELARVYGVRVLRIDAELVERDVYAAMAIVRSAF